MSASLVPSTELMPEMEAVLGTEARPEPMSVVVRQEKLQEKLNLDGPTHWSLTNAAAARELVLAYHDVFTLESNELGCTSAIEHEIHIKNSEPFKEQFWHIPPPLLEEVRTSLQDMLEAGAIHPSQSPWCNVVLVRKKDGTLCFCVDFRCLNAWTKDSYPLPCIQEALESMVGSAHCLSMDFKSGFWQIKMAPKLQQYTAFTVGNPGFYKFTCMPFRLCNAPATFQHVMQNTLGELNLAYCMIYLDDVIIFGHTEKEHLEHLRIVFKRFREFNLKLKPSKCSFFQSEIIYLAHHVSRWGHPTEPRPCASRGGIPNAQDLHAGTHILRISGALLEVYQGIHQLSIPFVRCVRERGKDGPGGSTPRGTGGHKYLEKEGPVHAHSDIPGF